MNDTREWLSIAEAAAQIGIDEKVIRARCEGGQLTCRCETTKSGPAWYIHPEGLQTFVARGTDRAESAGETMTLALQLSPEIAKTLQAQAARADMTPEAWAMAAVMAAINARLRADSRAEKLAAEAAEAEQRR